LVATSIEIMNLWKNGPLAKVSLRQKVQAIIGRRKDRPTSGNSCFRKAQATYDDT